MLLLSLIVVYPARADNKYILSLGGGVAPRYQGSNQYRITVAPAFSALLSNGIFIDTRYGAGYCYASPRGIGFASVALSYSRGRMDSDSFMGQGSNHLRGMGNVPGAVIARLRTGLRDSDGLELSVTVDAPLMQVSRGFAGHVDLAVPVFRSGRNDIVLTGSVHAATGRYMQTFYGVTHAQSASTGFRPYSLTGGVHSASLSAILTHVVSRHWSLLATAGISRLLGRYGDSPIVQTRSNYYGCAGAKYQF
ncbi:MipA/OmpV family protein [Burkholderia sp. Nafp2/4-1b]|uniref:MipA/OmpV family protein n=1 Tax=Burkholderia sp. Nafp2/4-1b TaxID=2116686 RepID=UPI001F095929|nr:MipA/OmpV family protein [Burkholderia sp. Nafp2/4-1b]